MLMSDFFFKVCIIVYYVSLSTAFIMKCAFYNFSIIVWIDFIFKFPKIHDSNDVEYYAIYST